MFKITHPVYLVDIYADDIDQGLFLSRDLPALITLKAKIEAAVGLAKGNPKEIVLHGPDIVVAGPTMDDDIVDAAEVIHENDLVYVPGNTVTKGELIKLFPPPTERRLSLLEILQQSYQQCKMNPLLEAAIICDLALNQPLGNTITEPEDLKQE